MVEQVLDLPELKIAKPSDTRWLAHEISVKAVKTKVAALNDIYDNTHKPEALGTALSKQYTVVAMYMLDYVIPQVATLSWTLQSVWTCL